MKILIAVDGSEGSRAAVAELCRRPWPDETQLLVMSVAHPIPTVRDPFMIGIACHLDSAKWELNRAGEAAAEAIREIAKSRKGFDVTTKILEGDPKERILEEAERWMPDLILVGSRGYGPVGRFLLGSVAQAVAVHAPCSVEIVR